MAWLKKDKIVLKVVQNRILHHILFWLFSFYVLLNLFSNTSEFSGIDYIYTMIFIITLQIGVYINRLIIIPYMIRAQKYFTFIFLLIMTILFAAFINLLLFNRLIDFILPGYYFISYYSYFDILIFFTAFILLTTLLKFSKEWFQLIESKQKLSEIEKEKAKIELKTLRTQINPHFLFNSLNVLYSLALKEAEESPDAIIKLSDILRYVIYDSNKDRIKLSSEIKLINDYLSLQNYRIDNTSKIDFFTDVKEDILIAPMLFLPLVENSFKHGIKGDLFETYVKIKLLSNNKETLFEIENNKGETENIEKESKGGIGIANIRHRLNLIYPEKHRFDIQESQSSFKVILKIEHEN